MHGSHPGYIVNQGSCPPIEIDSEAYSMHGTTGGCDGRGSEPAKPLGFLLFVINLLFFVLLFSLAVLPSTCYF